MLSTARRQPLAQGADAPATVLRGNGERWAGNPAADGTAVTAFVIDGEVVIRDNGGRGRRIRTLKVQPPEGVSYEGNKTVSLSP